MGTSLLRGPFGRTKSSGDKGVGFTFQAVGKDGTVYHSETSLLGKTFQGKLALWVMSSQPSWRDRAALDASSESLEGSGFIWTFGFGDKDDRYELS